MHVRRRSITKIKPFGWQCPNSPTIRTNRFVEDTIVVFSLNNCSAMWPKVKTQKKYFNMQLSAGFAVFCQRSLERCCEFISHEKYIITCVSLAFKSYRSPWMHVLGVWRRRIWGDALSIYQKEQWIYNYRWLELTFFSFFYRQLFLARTISDTATTGFPATLSATAYRVGVSNYSNSTKNKLTGWGHGISLLKCFCDPTEATLNNHVPAPPRVFRLVSYFC